MIKAKINTRINRPKGKRQVEKRSNVEKGKTKAAAGFSNLILTKGAS